MTKIRRGGYIFITWKGDHPPLHVHVFQDGDSVAKWDLENDKLMTGEASASLIELIHQLQSEGRL